MPTDLHGFRGDLQIVVRKVSGIATYLIKDPKTGEIYEVGEGEHFLCQQLDGRTPPAAILDRFERRFGRALPEEELEAFVRQLATQKLLVDSDSFAARPTFAEVLDPEKFLFDATIPLFRSDKFFSWLAPRLGWIFTRPVKFLSIALIVLAIYVLLFHLSDFWGALTVVRFPLFLQLTFAVAVCVSLLRAIAHGVLCKRYGGQVPGFGVTFLFYIFPQFFCDWSSVLWMAEKSKRLWTSLAGPYIQLLAWAMGTIAWWLTPPGRFSNTFWLVLSVTAAGGLVLLHGNPLVMAAGYRALVSWLEIPRLRERALAAFGAWVCREPHPEPLTRRERRWFIFYGLLSFSYVVGHLVFLLWVLGSGLTQAFQGGGALAALFVAIWFLQKPLGRYAAQLQLVRWLLAKNAGARRWAVRLALLGGVVVISLIPYPYETGGPFTILPTVRTEVHCEIDGGRIDQVFVREGELVKTDQPLAQIDRREYEKNLQATQAQLENAEARLRLLRRQLAMLDQPPNIEDIQALEAEVRRLQTLVADYKRELELTTLRAFVAGRVITPMVEQKVGQYLKKGDLFATIEQAEAVRIEIQVPEEDAPQIRVSAGVKVAAWAYPSEIFTGAVTEIAPIAATPAGSKINSVRVIAEIPNRDLRLRSQLTGYAKIKTEWIPLWLVLWHPLIRWFQVEFWYWLP